MAIWRSIGMRQSPDMETAAETIVHLAMIWGRAGVAISAQLSLVIACDKREAFAQGSESDEAIHASGARR